MNKKKKRGNGKPSWFTETPIKRNLMPYPPDVLQSYLENELCFMHSAKGRRLRSISHCKCINCNNKGLLCINWASVVENIQPEIFIDTREVLSYFDYDQKLANPMTDGRCWVCPECYEIIFVPREDIIFDSYEIHKHIDSSIKQGIELN